MFKLDLFIRQLGVLVKGGSGSGRKGYPPGTLSRDRTKIKTVKGDWVPVPSPEGRKAQAEATGEAKKQFDKLFDHPDEGKVTWDKKRKVKKIAVVVDGQLRHRIYRGKQRVGGTVPKSELNKLKSQKVAPRRARTPEGKIRVGKDGNKEISIHRKDGKVDWPEFPGFTSTKPGETVSAEELGRTKRLLSYDMRTKGGQQQIDDDGEEEEPKEYPADYSDLQPVMPYRQYMRGDRRVGARNEERVPTEILNFDDKKKITDLLVKVTPIRYEIMLSRDPKSNTKRPWFKGSVVQIGKKFFRVRHYQNISDFRGQAPTTLRRYVLTPVSLKAYQHRPVKFPSEKPIEVGKVMRMKRSGERFVVEKVVDKQADIPASTEKPEEGQLYFDKFSDVELEPSYEGRNRYVIHGTVLPPSEANVAEKESPDVQRTEEQKQQRRTGEAFYQFKQAKVGSEITDFWEKLAASRQAEIEDMDLDIQIAKDDLRAAKNEGKHRNTVAAARKRVKAAEQAKEEYLSPAGSLRQDHYNPFKRDIMPLAIDPPIIGHPDIRRGMWATSADKPRKVFYLDRHSVVWNVTATKKEITAGIKRGFLMKPPANLAE